MTIQERIASGEVAVANLYNAKGTKGLKVGDTYMFNYIPHVVVEVCDGELEGMLWIKPSDD